MFFTERSSRSVCFFFLYVQFANCRRRRRKPSFILTTRQMSVQNIELAIHLCYEQLHNLHSAHRNVIEPAHQCICAEPHNLWPMHLLFYIQNQQLVSRDETDSRLTMLFIIYVGNCSRHLWDRIRIICCHHGGGDFDQACWHDPMGKLNKGFPLTRHVLPVTLLAVWVNLPLPFMLAR